MANVFETAKAVDLVKVIQDYSGEELFPRGKSLSGKSCPLCGHNGCFGVYKNNTQWKCFSCSKGGDTISFVKELLGYAGNYDAALDICNRYGLAFDVVAEEPDPLYDVYTAIYDYAAKVFNAFYDTKYNPDNYYFQSRGLSDELIREYKLGYLPEVVINSTDGTYVDVKAQFLNKFNEIDIDDSNIFNASGNCIFAGRYIFPITNSKGKIVAFSGRSLVEGQPKYINTSDTKYFNKRNTLFNYHKAIKYPRVYVVEGQMDALSLVQAGIPNVVAAMGTAFGDAHLEMLKDKEIILALDNDVPGLKHMYNIIMNHKDIKMSVIKLKTYKDFNEALMSGADIKSLLKKEMLAPEFVIKYLSHTLDLSDVNCRSLLWKQLATLIGSNKDDSFRPLYPLNILYTPFEHSYLWTKCTRLIRGKRTKGGE